MRTIETKVYTIDEHPNKDLCFEWMRENLHDLNQHSVDEIICSIEELSKRIGGTFDYSISQVPDRGEHITFKNFSWKDLCSLDADKYPLTGICWDWDLINGLKSGNTNQVLESLHNDTEYIYSNEGLYEICDSSGYEFTESGEQF